MAVIKLLTVVEVVINNRFIAVFLICEKEGG